MAGEHRGKVSAAGATEPRSAAGAAEALAGQLLPWHEALADPARAQGSVLRSILSHLAQTAYGADHGAPDLVGTGRRLAGADPDGPRDDSGPAFEAELIAAFWRGFPVMTYDDYEPLIQAVMAGETRLLLSEEPVGWAITRGP
jgi:hypothetical protein